MKRLFPAPFMSFALFAIWLVLNQRLDASTLVMAALLAVALPLVTSSLRPAPTRVRRPLVGLRLLCIVLYDSIASNLQVAGNVWRIHPAPRSAFVRIPLELDDINGLAVLAVITTIVPGTVWCELAADRSALLLHVFDVVDEAAFVAHYKSRYERPLLEVFG